MSSLTEWLQTTLTNNFYQTDAETSDISSAFSPDAQIFWNHESISIDDYKQRTSANRFAKDSKIEWKDVFEIPDPENEGNGIVAGYLVATRYSKFKIRATPAQSQGLITMSAKIAKDQSDDNSPRKIVHLLHTELDKAVPVHLHGVVSQD